MSTGRRDGRGRAAAALFPALVAGVGLSGLAHSTVGAAGWAALAVAILPFVVAALTGLGKNATA